MKAVGVPQKKLCSFKNCSKRAKIKAVSVFLASSETVRPRTKILAPNFFSDFSRFFEQYNSKKKKIQFTADIERTARTEQSDNCHAQFVVSRCEAKKVWILLGTCIRNCNQVQDVVAQLWRNFAPPNSHLTSVIN